MTPATIDSIEEALARLVLEDGTSLQLPASLLPAGAREGDHVTISLQLDPGATRAAKERVEKIRGRLSSEDDGGDLKL